MRVAMLEKLIRAQSLLLTLVIMISACPVAVYGAGSQASPGAVPGAPATNPVPASSSAPTKLPALTLDTNTTGTQSASPSAGPSSSPSAPSPTTIAASSPDAAPAPVFSDPSTQLPDLDKTHEQNSTL